MKKITTTGSIKVELRVDDKLFDEIIKHKWNIFRDNLVQCKMNGKIIRHGSNITGINLLCIRNR